MKTVVIVYEKKICVNSIKTKSLFYQFCNNNSCTIQTSIFMVYSTTFESCKIIVKIQKDFWDEGRSQKHSPMSYSFTRFSVQHAYNHSSTVIENHRKSLISKDASNIVHEMARLLYTDYCTWKKRIIVQFFWSLVEYCLRNILCWIIVHAS